MFSDFVGDIKTQVATMLQAAVWGAVASAAGISGLLFLLIALFVWVADRYDTVTACITLGLLLAAVAATAAILFAVTMRRREARAAKPSVKSPKPLWLDPVIVATGLDIVRALGGRRATMLVLGALATTWLLTGAPAKDSAHRQPSAGL
jgi:hypothetical protein